MKNNSLYTKAAGALLGLACCDALGTTLEFEQKNSFTPITDMIGGGPFELEPGQWTDDTSMMLCLAESLIFCSGHDPADQMERYLRWYKSGENSVTGNCFDIGNTVLAAIESYQETGNPYAGSTEEFSAGNGSLMRVAPVALYFHRKSAEEACDKAELSSKITHSEQRCVDACRYFTFLIHTIFNHDPLTKEELLALPLNFSYQYHPDISKIVKGSYKDKKESEIFGTGFVVQSLEAALWCFFHSEDFETGALMAANLGDDADTTAAIYGQLAGAFYGVDQMPAEWLEKLYWRDKIQSIAKRLVC